MEETKDLYQYQKLEFPDSIRLLWLKPLANHQDDLLGSLEHTTLSEQSRNILEPYTALSYVWGAPGRTQGIWVDGHYLPITATLDAALRDLRDKTVIHRIWADAICIDQSNEKEKGSQVAMMGRIYSTATHTIIHLPLQTPGMESLLNAAFQADNLDHSGSVCSPADALQVQSSFGHLQRRVLEHPWFTRAWVFQELVLSRDSWVPTSYLSRARWTSLCKFLGSEQVLAAMRLTGIPRGVPKGYADPLLRMTRSETGSERLATPLYHLLASRRGIGATEPKDLIYAHLGVASDLDACRDYITVDYLQTTDCMFYDAARYLLANAGLDFLLCHAPGFRAENQPQSQLTATSWIPDWTQGNGLDPGTSTPSRARKMTYAQSRSYALEKSANFLIELEVEGVHSVTIFDPPTLSFTGVEWDIIQSLSMEISTDTSFVDPASSDRLDLYLATLAKNCFREPGLVSDPAVLRLSEICRNWKGECSQFRDPGILHRSDVDAHGRLPSGKLAMGRNRSLHVVPIDTQEGDIIVEVGPSHMLLVLRPIRNDLYSQGELNSMDSGIYKFFALANKGERAVPLVLRPHKEAQVTIITSGFEIGERGTVVPKRVAWQSHHLGSPSEPVIRHFHLVGEALCIHLVDVRYTTYGSVTLSEKAINMGIFTLH